MRPKSSTVIGFLICFLLFQVACANAQRIQWKQAKPLTWDDFKGKVPAKSKWAAVTNSRLRYSFKRDSAGSVVTKVVCTFNAKRSWKRNNRLKPYLLGHEQGHFDIAEIYARKTRRSFGNYFSRHHYNLNTPFRLRAIFERERNRLHRCQHKYDRQTRHSRNTIAQQKWNIKIATQLGKLSDFEVK